MEMPQIAEPSLSQKRLVLVFTKMNMKAIAETSLTMPKMPVRKREEETDVKPADMKITGASVMPLASAREWEENGELTIVESV
jgi:hypothetical protein